MTKGLPWLTRRLGGYMVMRTRWRGLVKSMPENTSEAGCAAAPGNLGQARVFPPARRSSRHGCGLAILLRNVDHRRGCPPGRRCNTANTRLCWRFCQIRIWLCLERRGHGAGSAAIWKTRAKPTGIAGAAFCQVSIFTAACGNDQPGNDQAQQNEFFHQAVRGLIFAASLTEAAKTNSSF